jgi:hypothetical protein
MGVTKPTFAERFTVKEIFMGWPNRLSLSDSRLPGTWSNFKEIWNFNKNGNRFNGDLDKF